MTPIFMAGVLSAWTAAHLGLALFFALAYVLGRRETEYLVFSLMCAALSVFSAGLAFDFHQPTIAGREMADRITHAGATLAAVFHVHFASRFVSRGLSRRMLVTLYALAAFFLVANASGTFWQPDSHRLVDAHAFGMNARHAIGKLTLIGAAFYLVGSLETIAAVAFLIRAYRNGRRETLGALVGAALTVGAIANDVGLAAGLIGNTVTLLPHVFLIYAFGTAGTLLWRYRVATGELEITATSLKQRTEELHHSYAELAEVQSELVKKRELAAVGELAAAIAHEVRNPLAVIVNAVAGLRRKTASDQDRTMLLGIVEEEAGRLNRLVTDLLSFARPISVARAPISLVELARRCRSAPGEDYEVDVQASPEDDPHVASVDPNLFRLALDKLVANACQAMRPGSTVEIRVARSNLAGRPAARLEIRDHGPGMGPDVLGRALDPFFTTRPSGTGLGLPIVQRIVQAHAGELTLESSEGQGTTAVISVPLELPEREPAQLEGSAAGRGEKKVA